MIYLDPHLCQDAMEERALNFPLDTFHCSDPRKMPVTKMDPSCTLAFYCRSRAEFTQLTQSVKDFVVAGHRHTDYPIFVFAEGTAPNLHEAQVREERVLKVKHKYLDAQGNVQSEQMSEDFIMIS